MLACRTLGPRRAGKTSVLNALRLRLRQSYRYATRAWEIRQPRTANALADTLGSDQAGRGGPADSLYKALTREKEKGKDRASVRRSRLLGKRGSPAVSWLRNRPGGIGGDRLRRHVTRLDQGGRGGEPQSGSSFGNDVTPVTLGPINRDDARTFLTKTAPPDVPFEADEPPHGSSISAAPGRSFAGARIRRRPRREDEDPPGTRRERERVHELYKQALLVERTRCSVAAGTGGRALRRTPSVASAASNRRRFQAPAPAEQDELIACWWRETSQGRIADPPFFDWIERQRAPAPRGERMTLFNPRGKFDPNGTLRRLTAGQSSSSNRPTVLSWAILGTRRVGKTGAMEAIRHILGAKVAKDVKRLSHPACALQAAPEQDPACGRTWGASFSTKTPAGSWRTVRR